MRVIVLLILLTSAATQEVSRATLRKLCEIGELSELGSGEQEDFEPAAVVYEVMSKRLENLENHITGLEQRLEEVPDAEDIEAMATAIRSELMNHINERMQLLTTEIRDSVEGVLVNVVANFAEMGGLDPAAPARTEATIPSTTTTTPTTTTPMLHTECQSYGELGEPSGIYELTVEDEVMDAYCDFSRSTGESWLVIQRRVDGSQDFYKTWQEYKEGFGSLTKEFYFGNEKIHKLTTQKGHKLKVEIYDQFGDYAYALYSNFSLSDEDDGYRLHFHHYSGTAGNALKSSKGRQFSTFDKDLDGSLLYSCARLHRGAFWYDRCGSANLNGVYQPFGSYSFNWQNIIWYTWKRDLRPMTRVTMSIMPEQDS